LKKELETPYVTPPTGPYSQGIMYDNLLFVSGQDGVHPDGSLAGVSVEEQTKACLENIEAILASVGASLKNIVYMTCHLDELNDETVREFNRVYESYFQGVEPKPARITVGSKLMGGKVEISAIAYKS